MTIKNGRYKDKNGAVRHFETNENMVIVDDGQKTLKQKLASLFESLSNLVQKFTAHETSETAHEDIRAELRKSNISDNEASPTTTGFNDLLSFAMDLRSKNCKVWHGVVSNFSDLPVQGWGFQCELQMTGGNILATINKMQSGGQVYVRETNASDVWVAEWKEAVDTTSLNEITIDRGYLGSFQVADLNEIKKNGKYTAVPATANIPVDGGWFNVDVTVDATGNGCQTAYCYSGSALGKTYTRYLTNGTISEWKEVATADGEIARLTNHTVIQDFDTFTTLNEFHRVDVNGGTTNFPEGADTFGSVVNMGNAQNTFQQVYYTSNGNIYTRGFRGWESPQWKDWKRVVYENESFTNKNLNNLNVDTTRGNWCAGVSVSDNTGTMPFGGWNNIMQFECSHFITQIGAGVNSSSSASKGLAFRSKWVSSESFGNWYEVATKEELNVSLLNGWVKAPSCDISAIKVGNEIIVSGIITNPSASNNIVAMLPPSASGLWEGGVAVSVTNEPRYLVLTPYGELLFQSGYTAGAYYSFTITYQAS